MSLARRFCNDDLKRKILSLLLYCTLGFNLLVFADQDRLSLPEVVLGKEDRILILAPHPDDEVLGCAGIIQKAVSKKVPVKIVFFTNGDSNQWSFLLMKKHFVVMPKAVEKMGMVRRDEALLAAEEFP